MSAREAVAAAESYARLMISDEAHWRTVYPATAALLAGEAHPLLDFPPGVRSGDVDPVQWAVKNATIRRGWQRYRIVYDVHPALWAELGDSDLSATVPAGLFFRLPHPDPFVVLPEPLVLPLQFGASQRITGFFVFAETATGDVVSTADPAAHTIGVAFGGYVTQPSGAPARHDNGRDPLLTWSWLPVSPPGGDSTVADLVATAVADVNAAPDRAAVMPDGWEEALALMLRRSLALLVYLCATNVDLTPLPRQSSSGARRAGGKAKARGPKPSAPVGVGYRVGAALAAHRSRESHGAAAGSGRTVAPHVRRAHFHTFKVGPGRQRAEVKWLAPIPVNVDGDADRSTVIPVPHRGG